MTHSQACRRTSSSTARQLPRPRSPRCRTGSQLPLKILPDRGAQSAVSRPLLPSSRGLARPLPAASAAIACSSPYITLIPLYRPPALTCLSILSLRGSALAAASSQLRCCRLSAPSSLHPTTVRHQSCSAAVSIGSLMLQPLPPVCAVVAFTAAAIVGVGPRFEVGNSSGVTHFLDRLAYKVQHSSPFVPVVSASPAL